MAGSLGEWLAAAPFALTMSSGFFSFYAHTGFLSVLEEEGLLPARISGSSAGALVGGAWAAGLPAAELALELERLERRDFWDPGVGPGLLRGRLFRERLDRLLPVATFAETRVPVAVSVFEIRGRTTRVIERGDLAPAIHASCAVPFLFHPVTIEGRRYYDGGILDRPGLMGMPDAEERVLFHHIASRSPWRLASEPLPSRVGMVTLAIDDLPRSGPFKLDAGRAAYRAAREATRRALDRTIEDARVVVRA
ncbi:MAG: patatin-like phospholipase family protein [Labilithrix sp.]|nr:patatin-like phospholipase family protein [Labilithrix sp.]MCW5815988.1 patatin-like phospholipase family protein [Labilithrix sp.]